MQKQFIKFLDHRGGKFNGYGYSFNTDRVISFKRNSNGHPMEVRSTYSINGYDVNHTSLQSLAVWIADQQLGPGPRTPSPVAHPQLSQIVPSFSYVVYSNKNKASQFFFTGTPISDAFAMFAKRGEMLDPDEVQVLNTISGQVFKLQQTVIYTLV